MQHIVVILVFALCLFWVVRRIVRMVSCAKKGDPRCATCTETSCPLRDVKFKKHDCKNMQ